MYNLQYSRCLTGDVVSLGHCCGMHSTTTALIVGVV